MGRLGQYHRAVNTRLRNLKINPEANMMTIVSDYLAMARENEGSMNKGCSVAAATAPTHVSELKMVVNLPINVFSYGQIEIY